MPSLSPPPPPTFLSLAHAQASPSAAIDLSSTSVTEGTAITVTMSFSNLAEDSDRATTDYLFRADVKDSENEDADGCEDQAGGYGLGVDRKINLVDEDPETRRGGILAGCPAGDYTVRASISDANGAELASATADFSVVAPEPPASTDAALSGLTLSGVTLEFDPATTTYAAEVGNEVSETTVTPTVNDDGATFVVKLDGSADDDGVIPLAVGENVISVLVTAEDGETSRTYTVTVTRAEAPPERSGDATLRSLALSGVTLEFDPATTTYAAEVGNDLAETTVTPTVNDDGATYVVRLDGAADDDGIAPLAVGENVVSVLVTAEDGETSRTYTVTVTRAEAPPVPPASTDATLRNLALSGVTLEFDPATTTYTAEVGNDLAETTVTPTVNDDGATYAVRLDGIADDDGIIPLAVGENVISVLVTAEDGETTRTYTVTFTRAEAPTSGPTVSISLYPVAVIGGAGNEIAVTLSFGNLTFDDDRATTDYIFRADVKDSEDGDADECEDQAGGYGLGVDRKINLVDEDPEVRRGAISADCPAGAYTLRASIANADNEELASATAEFYVLPLYTAVVVEEPEEEEPRVARQIDDLGFDLDSANGTPRGIWSNGTTIWVLDNADLKLYARTLAGGARDSSKDISLYSANGNPTGVWSDGTTVWVADAGDEKLYAYTLDGGARDTSKEFDLAGGTPFSSNNNGNSAGIWSDGTTMWVADRTDRKVYAYTLNGGVRDTGKEFSLVAQNTIAAGMWSDGATIWVGDPGEKKALAYTLSDGSRVSGQDISFFFSSNAWGIWSDGDTLWMVDGANTYVFAYPLPKTPTDATLSALTLSAGTLDPSFAGVTEEYAASVDNGVASVTVTAAATDANAALAITYGSDATAATGGVVPLSVGPNSITVTVTPVVGTAKTYTLTVTRRAPASLTVVWTPQSGNSQQYEVSWTDPVACPSGTNYYAYALLTGDISIHFDIGNVASTVFTVTGTPTVLGVGVASMHTVEVYCGIQGQPTSRLVASVELTGTTGGTFRFPANDATLSALTLSGVTLAFDPATLSYTVSVGNDVAETTVTPTPNHAEASYAIKLNGAADADGVIPLAVGGNVITVVVTAEDGETSRTYTVTITREESLATLTVVGTQPDPNITRYTFAISWVDGFSCASGTNYYAYFHLFYKHTSGIGWRDLENVASSANTMSVTHTDVSFNPELRHPNIDASLVLYCGERASGREVGRVDVTDAVGTFIFPSTDSTLSALSVGGVPAPGFAPATTEYSMTVDNNVARTTVTPTLNHATASFEVTPEDADPDTDGHQVDLAVGANVITAVVTAQDDSTTTYTVTVTRVPSTDASLRRLTFSGIADFQFVPGTLTYNVEPILNLLPRRLRRRPPTPAPATSSSWAASRTPTA